MKKLLLTGLILSSGALCAAEGDTYAINVSVGLEEAATNAAILRILIARVTSDVEVRSNEKSDAIANWLREISVKLAHIEGALNDLQTSVDLDVDVNRINETMKSHNL